jgi:cytochrome P450/NADPH-cytochrome P450 reductase
MASAVTVLQAWVAEIAAAGEAGIRAAANIIDKYVLIPTLLAELSAVHGLSMSFAEIAPLLARQKDRFYSISSSSVKNPHCVRLTVGVVSGVNSAGVAFEGLCSSYLASLKPGDIVRASVNNSNFRLPRDPRSP